MLFFFCTVFQAPAFLLLFSISNFDNSFLAFCFYFVSTRFLFLRQTFSHKRFHLCLHLVFAFTKSLKVLKCQKMVSITSLSIFNWFSLEECDSTPKTDVSFSSVMLTFSSESAIGNSSSISKPLNKFWMLSLSLRKLSPVKLRCSLSTAISCL